MADPVLPVRPSGFPLWLGRLLAAVLLLAAIGLAVAYVTDSDPSPARPADGSQGIRLN